MAVTFAFGASACHRGVVLSWIRRSRPFTAFLDGSVPMKARPSLP